MKVFVTGVTGQLGHDVVKNAAARGHQVTGSGSRETDLPDYVPMDITDRASVFAVLTRERPDAVIHCAAWTAVDAAEDEPEACRAVNTDGTRYIAEACRELGAKLVFVSTDYVFDGEGTAPWKADGERYAPLSVYGASKRDAELAVAETLERFFVVRTAWVFGANGKNFLKTMLRVGKTNNTVRVVCDQIGSPTYTVDLARLLVDMAESDKYGFYHATNGGDFISWYELTCELYRQAGYTTRVVPITTAEYTAARAHRPLNSRLDKSKLTRSGLAPLPDWRDAVERYLKEIGVK